MNITYKGVTIELLDNDEWYASDYGSNASLAALKSKIDKTQAKEKTFTRFTAWYRKAFGETKYVRVTVTSVTDEGEVWVVNGNGKREKVYRLSYLYADTAESFVRIAAIQKLLEQRAELDSQLNDLESELTVASIPTAEASK